MFYLFLIINLCLYPIELILKVFFNSNKEIKNKIIVIIGNYASSTTLMMQVIATIAKVNFINNLTAKFFLCPTIGQKLNYFLRLFFEPRSNYYSDDGITNGILEPSEFGWYWRFFFWHKYKMNIKKFNSEIKIFTENKFNNFMFKYCMHRNNRELERNYKYFELFKKNTLIIYPYRKKKLVINSILNRRKNLNNVKSSYKFKFKNKDLKGSIESQVTKIYREHELFLKKFKTKQIHKISFEQFKKNRDTEIQKLIKFLNRNGIETFDKNIIKKKLKMLYYKPDIKKI